MAAPMIRRPGSADITERRRRGVGARLIIDDERLSSAVQVCCFHSAPRYLLATAAESTVTPGSLNLDNVMVTNQSAPMTCESFHRVLLFLGGTCWKVIFSRIAGGVVPAYLGWFGFHGSPCRYLQPGMFSSPLGRWVRCDVPPRRTRAPLRCCLGERWHSTAAVASAPRQLKLPARLPSRHPASLVSTQHLSTSSLRHASTSWGSEKSWQNRHITAIARAQNECKCPRCCRRRVGRNEAHAWHRRVLARQDYSGWSFPSREGPLPSLRGYD